MVCQEYTWVALVIVQYFLFAFPGLSPDGFLKVTHWRSVNGLINDQRRKLSFSVVCPQGEVRVGDGFFLLSAKAVTLLTSSRI